MTDFQITVYGISIIFGFEILSWWNSNPFSIFIQIL